MKKIILLILVCMCFSCKQSSKMESGNEQEISTEIADTISAEQEPEIIEDFSIKFKTLGFKKPTKKFLIDFISENNKGNNNYSSLDSEADYVTDNERVTYFYTNIDIQNNTPHKITSFEVKYIIKAIFADGKTIYSPFIFASEEDEENLLDNGLWNDFGSVKKDKNWNPKEIREYYLMSKGMNVYIPGTFFAKKDFERTPESLTLIMKYKAISIDEEYTKIISYDILDSWKEYQTELGLR